MKITELFNMLVDRKMSGDTRPVVIKTVDPETTQKILAGLTTRKHRYLTAEGIPSSSWVLQSRQTKGKIEVCFLDRAEAIQQHGAKIELQLMENNDGNP